MDEAGELERAYRQEATRIRAALAARLGDVALAEESVQDAFIEAVEHWRAEGVPPNPGGWLATTAWRKAIDRIRRDRAGQEKLALLAAGIPPSPVPGGSGMPGEHDPWAAGDEADELLGLIFACCHPSLSRESQIALTLRVVCGLTTAEISAAFLASEPAMAQRLSRARTALRETGAAPRIPDPDQLGMRLGEVLAVIYLLFNEGYLASAGLVQQHQRQQAQHLGLARHQRVQQPVQRHRLGGEVAAGRGAPRAGQIALVEHQVDDGKHLTEPAAELVRIGDARCRAGLSQRRARPGQPLRHRRLAGQERG